MTNTNKLLPDFLVLGTQKGGTTSLHKLLQKHKEVYLPAKKEIQYFSIYSDKPVHWYTNHFKDSTKGQIKGDITPFYMFHPMAATRIKAIIPKTKLIILLRDPVERTLSQIFHAKRHGFEKLDVVEAIEAERDRLESGSIYSLQKHSYVARSKYIEQIDRYEKLFPKKQIMIIKSENLFTKTEETIKEIEKFIGVSYYILPNILPAKNTGQGEAQNVKKYIHEKLRNELSSTALAVKERYGIDWGWN